MNENKTEHNQKWPYIPDHPYRILILGGSGSVKTNVLLNLINNQLDIDKIYLYAKDPYEAKYQFLINKIESAGLKLFNDPKAFIEYSNDMQDVYKNIDDQNAGKKRKILIIFDIIVNVINNKKLNSIVTELFIRLNATHFFITKISNKRELQQIALNHSSDISSKDFINFYKKCTVESYSLLVNDARLASDNPLRYRKNIFNI